MTMAELYCPNCRITYANTALKVCPACDTALEAPDVSDDDGKFSMALPFSTFRCDSCDRPFILDRSRKCPHCGAAEDALDPVVEKRIAAFGSRVQAMTIMPQQWSGATLDFARRGKRPDAHEHFHLLSDVAIDKVFDLLQELKRLLGAAEWRGGDPLADSALDELIAICTDIFFTVAAIAKTAPPVALIAIHRQAARQLARFGDAVAAYIQATVAPTMEDAKRLAEEAQQALDEAGEFAGRLGEFVVLEERSLALAPGWWTAGDDYDVGRAVWEGVGAAAATVEDGAARVRRALKGVPGLGDLDDSQAFQLLPAVSLAFYDPVRLVDKARQARELLDAATRVNQGWITDESLLVNQVWEAHRKFTDQVVQLGFHLQHEAPRTILLHAATDMYSKLMEGPFRHFGAIVYSASRVAARKPSRYDQQTAEETPYSTVLNHFVQTSPDLGEGALTLLRNAEAHYSFEITADGIEFRDTHRGPGGMKTRRDFLGDDDFIEELSAVVETLAAFEIALLPFLWSSPSSTVQTELALLSKDPSDRAATIRGLSGLKGFVEMTFQEDGETLRIAANYLGDAANPFIEILPSIATIWENWPVDRVEVTLPGRDPTVCVYHRSWFAAATGPNPYIKNHSITLAVREVRSRTSDLPAGGSAELDVRFGLLPFLVLTVSATQAILDEPIEAEIQTLREYLTWYETRMSSLRISDDVHGLASAFAKAAEELKGGFGNWQVALRAGDAHWQQRARATCIRAVAKLESLLAEAREYLSH